MMELIPILGILSSSTMVVLIVYFISRSRARRAEVQAEVQSRLIDRFGTAPELIEFLQSPAGRQFVSGVQSSTALLTRERILSGFSRAIMQAILLVPISSEATIAVRLWSTGRVFGVWLRSKPLILRHPASSWSSCP